MHLARALIYAPLVIRGPPQIYTLRVDVRSLRKNAKSRNNEANKMDHGCAKHESELTRGGKWYAWNQLMKCGGAGGPRWPGEMAHQSRRWWGDAVASTTARGPVGRAGAYFKPARALHRPTDRFAKPSVMQGVPLPTRGCSRTAGRKSGTRRSGSAARAASARPANSSEVSLSVVSVSLLERWNCVAQVLRLHRDYFKLDN